MGDADMAPEAVMEWAKALAVVGGVCVGIFAVFSPSWVWFSKQIFKWGSALLCCFGTILIVSSMFRNVTLVVDAPKLEFRLNQIAAQLTETQRALANANDQITRLAAAVGDPDISRIQFARLESRIDSVAKRLSDGGGIGLLTAPAFEEKLNVVAARFQQALEEQSKTITSSLARTDGKIATLEKKYVPNPVFRIKDDISPFDFQSYSYPQMTYIGSDRPNFSIWAKDSDPKKKGWWFDQSGKVTQLSSGSCSPAVLSDKTFDTITITCALPSLKDIIHLDPKSGK